MNTKPITTYAQFVRENAQANLRRLAHTTRLEHHRDGCPLDIDDNLTRCCPIHGFTKENK